MRKLILLLFLVSPSILFAQSHNYWSRNFNEESSLLSGAVVGGGAGASAIFYNPASISEINESKLSLNASLFSFDFVKANNAMGDNLDVNYIRGVVVPRFISYMLKPKNRPKWRLEAAFLNNEDFRMEIAQSVDQRVDVLSQLPGIERHYAHLNYRNRYRDDWVGIGGSREMNPNLYIGASMFISVQSLDYSYSEDIMAGPTDSIFIDNQYIPFYSATYKETELVKFIDYRILWKFGMLVKKDRISFGLNITTPSIGGIFTDGKKVMHEKSQSNIYNQYTGEAEPNYFIADYTDKKNMFVNAKSTFSVAAGFNWHNYEETKTLYTTVEFFAGTDPYNLVEANENPDIATGPIYEGIDQDNWLTYMGASKPIFNAAIGYRWIVKENVMVLAGFRTDFNSRKKHTFPDDIQNKLIRGLNLDIYHFTGGLSLKILGQDLITGLQYSIGGQKNQEQFINLTNPIEFNPGNNTALQSAKQNKMNTLFNSISIYLGATLNFGERDNKKQDE